MKYLFYLSMTVHAIFSIYLWTKYIFFPVSFFEENGTFFYSKVGKVEIKAHKQQNCKESIFSLSLETISVFIPFQMNFSFQIPRLNTCMLIPFTLTQKPIKIIHLFILNTSLFLCMKHISSVSKYRFLLLFFEIMLKWFRFLCCNSNDKDKEKGDELTKSQSIW